MTQEVVVKDGLGRVVSSHLVEDDDVSWHAVPRRPGWWTPGARPEEGDVYLDAAAGVTRVFTDGGWRELARASVPLEPAPPLWEDPEFLAWQWSEPRPCEVVEELRVMGDEVPEGSG